MAKKQKSGEELTSVASISQENIRSLMTEKRVFKPPKEFAKKAHVNSMDVYKKANANPEKFWEGWANSYTGLNHGKRS